MKKALVIAAAVATWLSLNFEVMAFLVFNTTGMLWYGVALAVSLLIFYIGLKLVE